jgi:hypothetical protein
MSNAKLDQNSRPTLTALSSAGDGSIVTLYANPTTHRLLTDLAGGSGTVTSVSVTTANGVSGTVATATTTPAITLSLGAITPTTVNGLTFAAQTNGFTIAGGTTSKTLTVPLDASVAGTNTGDQDLSGLVTTAQTSSQTIGDTSHRVTKLWVTDITCTNAIAGSVTGNAATATTAPTTAVLVSQVAGQTIGDTTNRLTKLWATDITCTNAITGSVTGNAGTVSGLTFTSGKTLAVSNILTLAGTDSTTMTFPSTSASVARTDAAQTFTGTQTFSQVLTTSNAITATSNAATVPITSKIHTVTNDSAATLTITLTTTSATDGQTAIVRVLDSSAAAQTITWVNTENSTVSVPATSNGSTTLPVTVGFQYNAGTSKWRCLASA